MNMVIEMDVLRCRKVFSESKLFDVNKKHKNG